MCRDPARKCKCKLAVLDMMYMSVSRRDTLQSVPPRNTHMASEMQVDGLKYELLVHF